MAGGIPSSLMEKLRQRRVGICLMSQNKARKRMQTSMLPYTGAKNVLLQGTFA